MAEILKVDASPEEEMNKREAIVSRPLFRNKTALTVPKMQDTDGASAVI